MEIARHNGTASWRPPLRHIIARGTPACLDMVRSLPGVQRLEVRVSDQADAAAQTAMVGSLAELLRGIAGAPQHGPAHSDYTRHELQKLTIMSHTSPLALDDRLDELRSLCKLAKVDFMREVYPRSSPGPVASIVAQSPSRDLGAADIAEPPAWAEYASAPISRWLAPSPHSRRGRAVGHA